MGASGGTDCGNWNGAREMSKQVTMTMYAHASQYSDQPFSLFHCDMSEHGHVCLGQVEVTFTPPTTDPVAAELDSIDKAMQSVRAELQGKLNALQERRDNLLAIGSDGHE